MAVVASMVSAPGAFGASSLLFDNISPLFASTTSSSEGLYNTGDNPGSEYMGGIYVLPAGTSQITGYDVLVVNDIGDTGTQDANGAEVYNSSAMTLNYVKITTYFWGGYNQALVNSSAPAISATNPAFSDLLGTQTTPAENVGLPTGYTQLFVGGPPYETATPSGPGLTLSTPVNLPTGVTTVGVTFTITASSTSAGPFVNYPLLTPGVTEGNPPTVGGQLNGFFENTSGETNGNFDEFPYTFGLTDNAVGTRLWGTISGADNWSNAGGGAWETGTNWSFGSAPTSANDVAFNLSSPAPGYTVGLFAADACNDLYVQNDNVTISVSNLFGSLAVTNVLSVGNGSTGTLALTNQYPYAANVSVGTVTVGGNGGNGVLTVGSYINLVSTGNVSIGASSALNLSGGTLSGTPSGVLIAPNVLLAGTTGAWTGKIDIGTHALDLSAADLTTVTSQAKFGYNGGTWNATGGITSSAAASDTMHLTAVGVISNNIAINQAWMGSNASTGTLYGSAGALGTFEGLNPGTNDVLVKYTYYGDCLLQGSVTGSDYSIVDNTYLNENFSHGVATNPISGWYNGDFNYDGVVDGSDYTLMDNAFNSQSVDLLSDVVVAPSSGSGAAGTSGINALNPTLTDSYLNDSASLVQVASPTTLIAGSPVPEPTSVGLLAIGSVGLLTRRRRQSKVLPHSR
jgi:hypothetical protein